MEQITLYFRQGSSDKIYQASIEPKNGGYVVNFAYGRRGTMLNTGTKTPAGVHYGAAKAIYEKLVNEKTAKGYTPGANGTPYQFTGREERSTGIHCQLLNPIDEDQVQRIISNPVFCMQEKFDGRRTLISKSTTGIIGINRRGLAIALPEPISETAAQIPTDCLIDGECMGNEFIAFDVLSIADTDVRSWAYHKRLFALNQLLIGVAGSIHIVETAMDATRKAGLFQTLKDQGKEGVVFKNLNAPYSSGRPSSGGDQLKFKFVETASFIVGSLNEKRSVTLKLLNGKSLVSAGNVTIPSNHQIPIAGTVVEVKYFYAFRESGCIYQPIYLGAREDIDPGECLVSQLKYKPEMEVTLA